MRNYLDKPALYAAIDEYRSRWGISLSDYPINTVDLCAEIGRIIVRDAMFFTPGLRGMATKRSSFDSSDIILLNQSRSREERNFDCGHELIHLTLHRTDKTQTFQCFDHSIPTQDAFLEWQANEGAAELIVPYRLLLPMILDEMKLARRMGIKLKGKAKLFPECYAPRFGVSQAFMSNRIDSLLYEICQYSQGRGLDQLEILSKTQQEKRKVDLRQYPIYSVLKA